MRACSFEADAGLDDQPTLDLLSLSLPESLSGVAEDDAC